MNYSLHAFSKRIDVIDTLRGFALLGIVIMNIQAFAMPSQAYFNPFAFGVENSDIFDRNGIVYMITHLFADQKIMTIFSLLFGVSIALMVESHTNKRPLVKGKPVSSLHLLLRRNLFLFFIGLDHAYLIWEGDILVSYSLCGFFVVWFRHESAKYLIFLGSILFIVPVVFLLLIGFFVPEALMAAELQAEWVISAEELEGLSNTLKGSWFQQLSYRIPAAFEMQTALFMIYTFWRVSSLMLWGMAAYKLGLFQGKISTKCLGWWALFLISLGLMIVTVGIQQNNAHQWQAFYAIFFGSHFNYIGSIVLSIGYILSFIILSPYLPFWITYSLQCVGRTALSNYLLQSLTCAFIFYGHGLGLFAQLDRFEQLLILPFIWFFQIALSILWLHYFRQGPIEWLWRCAVAWTGVPIRK